MTPATLLTERQGPAVRLVRQLAYPPKVVWWKAARRRRPPDDQAASMLNTGYRAASSRACSSVTVLGSTLK